MILNNFLEWLFGKGKGGKTKLNSNSAGNIQQRFACRTTQAKRRKKAKRTGDYTKKY